MKPTSKLGEAAGDQCRAFLQCMFSPGTGVPPTVNKGENKMHKILIASVAVAALAAGATVARAEPAGTLALHQTAGKVVLVADGMSQSPAARAAPGGTAMAPGVAPKAPQGVDPAIWQAITIGTAPAYGLPPVYWQEIVGGSGGGGS